MKYLPPLEIASKIMTLIEDANEQLVIVSPYVNLAKWDKMKNCLERALKRGVKLTFYIRENHADNDIRPLLGLGITPIKIKNLHAKLYYNEAYGIVTSQNMIQYSDEYSIDIGYMTETEQDLKELVQFTKRHLNPQVQQVSPVEKPVQAPAVEKAEPGVIPSSAVVDAIYQVLSGMYGTYTLNRSSEYIFSSKILGGVDIMAGVTLIFKLYKANRTWEDSVRKLKAIERSRCKGQFSLDVQLSHNSYAYITYTPATITDPVELAEDYLDMIKQVKVYFPHYSQARF